MNIKNKLLQIIGFLFGRTYLYSFGKILQHISHRMMGIGNYENDKVSGEVYVIEYIKKIFPKNKKFVFIDIGAGDSSNQTQIFHKHFTKLSAYLYEPMPNTFLRLSKKFSKYRSIKTFNFAIGNKNGNIKIFDYDGKQTEHATLHKSVLDQTKSKISSRNIKIITLKKVINDHNLKHINFLKIDTEGNEHSILYEFKDHFEMISVIQFEFNSMNIFSKVQFKNFIDLLSPQFKIFRMYQNGLLEITEYNPIYQEIYEFQNYLAVNKKFKQ